MQVFIISIVTDDMITVPVAWGFLTNKNKYLYEHGVFQPIRKKLEELQGVYLAKPANIDYESSIDDDSLDDEDNNPELAPVKDEKIVVCDFEKAILIGLR